MNSCSWSLTDSSPARPAVRSAERSAGLTTPSRTLLLAARGETDGDIAPDDELEAGQHTTRVERPPLHGRGGRPVAGGALQPEDRLLAGSV